MYLQHEQILPSSEDYPEARTKRLSSQAPASRRIFRENEYIQLTIDGHDYIYKIFSVAFIYGSDATFLPHLDDISIKSMKNFLTILDQNSIYDYDVDVNENDKIISVITCNRIFSDDSKEVIYINGRLLRENEKIKNYGVKKNKKYGILEDLWEDVEDEEV